MTEEFIDLTVDGGVEPDITEMEIEVEESIGWVADTEMVKHIDLPDRNTPDQHIISSITGLEDRLADIESIKTVESDKVGVANYYAWDSVIPAGTGYFVSLASHSTRIKICDGTNIFGVTVDEAGFVGNQGKITPRDNVYGLVATSGLVDVRCETGINVGDNVVSNADGVAVKTDPNCGYKVIAKETKKGVEYVSIVLGVQACTTNLLGQRVGKLEADLKAAESNIAEAVRVATEAAASAGSSSLISNDVNDKIDNVYVVVDGMQNTLDEDVKIFEEAAKAAKEAAEAAQGFADNAVNAANDAMSRADTLKEETDKTIKGMSDDYEKLIGSIDKYVIGEYSTSYGLTINQAQDILNKGMIYIPYPETHTEIYEYKSGAKIYTHDQTFTEGYYYVWNGPTQLKVYRSDNDGAITIKDISWWETVSDSNGNPKRVWCNATTPPAGESYDFWFDGATLYKLEESEWVKVNTLAGNVNARIQSMIRQDVDSISNTVSNLAGSVTGFEGRIDDVESSAQQLSTWKTQEDEKMASVRTVANGDSTSVVISALVKDNAGEIQEGAQLTLTADNNSSVLKVNAENIGFTADDYAVIANNIHMSAGTVNLVKGYNNVQQNANYQITSYSLIPSESSRVYWPEGSKDNIGCLVPEKSYTIQIDITPGSNVDTIALYISQSFKWVTQVNVVPGKRQIIRKTFTCPEYVDGKEPSDAAANADVRLFRNKDESGKTYGKTTIHQIKIEEGTAATGFDVLSSDFSSSQMNWKMNRDKCVWWNEKTTETEPLMKLDNTGLSIKGKVDATSGKIGAWNVGNVPSEYIGNAGFTNALYSTTFDSTDVTGKAGNTTVIRASNQPTDWAFLVHNKDKEDNYTEIFGVKHDGFLYAQAGKIGALTIQKNGIATPNQWSLTESGLTLYSTNSEIKVGNLRMYNRQNNNKEFSTYLHTDGPLTIKSSGDASITLNDESSDNVQFLIFSLEYCRNPEGLAGLYFRAEVTIDDDDELWYDQTIYVNCQTYSRSSIDRTKYLVKEYNIPITIKAGQKQSDAVAQFSAGDYLAIYDPQTQKYIEYITSSDIKKDFTSNHWYDAIGYWYEKQVSKPSEAINITGHLIPIQENNSEYNLGAEKNQWNIIYAKQGRFGLLYSDSGKVDVSDRNKKNTINDLNNNYNLIFDKLRPVTFKYNDGTSNRLHTGFIAQEVKESVLASGLTTKDFAGYCEWFGDNGVETCGLRYSEFISLNTWQIQKLKGRVAELEAKLNELTEKNNQTVQND